MNLKKHKKTDNEKCWKIIGVYGDGSCPEIEKHAHCRNCPKYLHAVREFHDREIPPELIEEWTAVYTKSKIFEEPNAVPVVVFRLMSEWFAIKVTLLEEVTFMLPIHHVPFRSGPLFRGLVNLKGHLLPCVAAEQFLGIAKNDEGADVSDAFRHLIVVNKDGDRYIFGVNEIIGMYRVPQLTLKKIPSTLAQSSGKHLAHVFQYNDRTVGFLDDVSFVKSLERSLMF